MSRIQKIDNYQKDFPNVYGIESDFCYAVVEDFTAQALIEYKESGTISGIKCYEPSWNLINILDGDYLMSSKNGLYVLLKDFDGLIEIRPQKEIGSQKPSFDFINKECLVKIGKDSVNSKIMSLEERTKIIPIRGI